MFYSTISYVSGYLSMGCWLFAQLPQVIENYRNHSVDGLAPGFLGSWIAGDLSNLIGCLLTGALPFQVLLSSYYCSIDLVLASQFLYYTKIYPRLRTKKLNQRLLNISDHAQFHEALPHEHLGTSESQDVFTKPISLNNGSGQMGIASRGPGRGSDAGWQSSFSNMVTGSFLASFSKVAGAPLAKRDNTFMANPAINAVVTFALDNQKVGTIFAWVCTCLYLSARIPQLIKNYKRKSTEGLAPLLFLSALHGNIFYTMSILTCDEFVQASSSAGRYEFFMKELPYILGSAGTVAFDLVFLYQWRVYKPKHVDLSQSNVSYSRLASEENEQSIQNDAESAPYGVPAGTSTAVSPNFSPNLPINSPGAYATLRELLVPETRKFSEESRDSYGTLTVHKRQSSSLSTPLTPWDLLEIAPKQ